MQNDLISYPGANQLVGLSHRGSAAILNTDEEALTPTRMCMLKALSEVGVEPLSEWLKRLHQQGLRQLLRESAALIDLGWVQTFCIPISQHWADDLQHCLELIAGNGGAVLADMQGLLISSHQINEACAEQLAGCAAEMASIANKYKKPSPRHDEFLSLALQQNNDVSCFFQLNTPNTSFVLATAGGKPEAEKTSAFHHQLMTMLWILQKRYEVNEANQCVKK
ncbi:Uncharacterised protein [BD1-7 clade bacterium]|uniref:Uncharacterized protein n=1 Tax=BD1-7 clade bacterium TaxID=2029982 RepID=A0A5S9MY03_9GAMM|nr:Uncharacterised protein [BD1-7 clade bacterium]